MAMTNTVILKMSGFAAYFLKLKKKKEKKKERDVNYSAQFPLSISSQTIKMGGYVWEVVPCS